MTIITALIPLSTSLIVLSTTQIINDFEVYWIYLVFNNWHYVHAMLKHHIFSSLHTDLSLDIPAQFSQIRSSKIKEGDPVCRLEGNLNIYMANETIFSFHGIMQYMYVS